MKRTFPRPKWFTLYMLTFLYLGAFWLVLKAGLSQSSLIWVEAGLTCAYFVLVLAWLNANEQAMWMEEQEKREISRQAKTLPANRVPEQVQKSSPARKGNTPGAMPLVLRFSPVLPAWVVAVVSHLVDLFQGHR